MLRSCNGYLDINDEKNMSDKTVLVVDDETAIRDMICSALDVAGFDTLQAENAQQAHAMIIDHKPDLVLLDWMMPVTSGIELIRRLQRDDLTKNIPVIMLTAKGDETDRVVGLELGADDYVTKPFALAELLARVHAVLRRAQLTKDHSSCLLYTSPSPRD